MEQAEPTGLVDTEATVLARDGQRRASIPFAIIALVLAVLPLALLALPVPGAGLLAAAAITVSVVVAIIAVDRAVRGAPGRTLAVVALALAVTTGMVSTAAGLASGIAAAAAAFGERGGSIPSGLDELLAGEAAAAPASDAQISGEWVVDELLRACAAGRLHAVAAPGSTTLFLVGERPVSVDAFAFTVTVTPGDESWTASVRGDVPAGSDPVSGEAVNPLGCADIELDAQSGEPVGGAGDAPDDAAGDPGAGGDDAGGADAPPAPEGEVNYWELEVGMCVNDADLPETFLSIPLVDCAQPHDSEVYAIETLDEGPYPGEDEVFRLAEEICLDTFEPYVGISYDRSLFYFGYYWPDKNNWGGGDRDVICVLYDQNGPIEGSMRGSGR